MREVADFRRVDGLMTEINHGGGLLDGYYVAYKSITLPCISFLFIEIKFIHCHTCVMFVVKSMSICND